MKKILFVLSVTQCGGVTVAFENLIELMKDEYTFKVISLDNVRSKKISSNVEYITVPKVFEYLYSAFPEKYPECKGFQRIKLIIVKGLTRFLGLKKVLDFVCKKYRLPEEYDVAISFSNDIHLNNRFAGGANDFVLKCVSAKEKIGWIHNDPDKYNFTVSNSFATYSRFDKVVNVSYACKEKFDAIFPMFKEKSFVVWNCINYHLIDEISDEYQPYDKSQINVVTVARLDNQQKRLDRVIKVSELLVENNVSGFRWTVVGNGKDKEMLQELCAASVANENIEFVGEKKNPYPYMRYADLFVLPSDYESFGIVLHEAMYLNCPVITTNFSAAKEVIAGNPLGIICENSTESLFKEVYGRINEIQQGELREEKAMNVDLLRNRTIEQFRNIINN